MDSSPATRASLLIRLRDPHDADAWRQFVQVYAPVVYGFAAQTREGFRTPMPPT